MMESYRWQELWALERITAEFGDKARVLRLEAVQYKGKRFPLYALVVGSDRPSDPALGFFGGVHGLERIGSEVALAHMRTVLELLRWDDSFHQRLQRSRLVFMPIVNPVGISLGRRSNGNGVDLMRNAPVEAEEGGSLWVRGHRVSPHLPWYRGAEGQQMEIESRALCQVVQSELMSSNFSMAVDIHSGFGAVDRLWFPYAKSRRPFPDAAAVYALKHLLDRSHPHQFYRIEPVSRQYTFHGDLWDHLYDQHQAAGTGRVFLPWTLEMGSWMWIKKNPMQLLSYEGAFHPKMPHRLRRVLRRHYTLFDFLHRSLLCAESWLPRDDAQRQQLHRAALHLWYGGDA